MNPPPPVSPWSWNARNLTALVILLGLIGGMIVWRAMANRTRVDSEFRVDRAPVAPADERIDPNTASWASLARLPGIGESRAKAIIKYRQAHAATPAFLRAEDLDNVVGIGPTTVQRIRPYLAFPTTQPETSPGDESSHRAG